MDSENGEACPNCETTLTVPARGSGWCPQCEWGLQDFTPPTRAVEWPIGGRLRRRFDQLSHKTAFDLNATLFAEQTSRRAARPGWTVARATLLTVSTALLLGTVALVLVGLKLLFTFPVLTFVLGIFMLLIGFEVRPRVPKIKNFYATVERTEAPTLFRILDQVAAEVGNKPVNTLGVDQYFNASCGRSGLRRKRVLILGLPLWGALSGQARIALLGHEFGHLVNGDPEQALLTQPALTTFGRIADITYPNHRFTGGAIEWIAEGLVRILLVPIYAVSLASRYVMCWIGMRDSQRSEYLADDVALRLAGTEGARDLSDTLLYLDGVRPGVSRAAAKASDPREWHAAAAAIIAERTNHRAIWEQKSIREEASLWESHPPAGFRSRVTRSGPSASGSLRIDSETWLRADAELANLYRRVARALNR
ncbi:M48 family metallopeptidase [Jatrophihabitans sp. DSM 45814]